MALPGGSSPSNAWTTEVVDTVDAVVTTVRDKAVVPLTTVARALVYGVVAGLMAQVVLLLLGIAAVRALDVYAFDRQPGQQGHIWAVDLAVGGIFTLIGLLLWTKRRPKGTP